MEADASNSHFIERTIGTATFLYGVFCMLFLAMLTFVDSDFHRFLVTIIVLMGVFYLIAGIYILKAKYYYALVFVLIAFVINIRIWVFGSSLAFVLIFDILPTIFFVYIILKTLRP